jgi:peptidoglycan/LPS O-acetylase OafA/YrhL
MTDLKQAPARLSGLDGLRGIAVAGVLLFHADRFGSGFFGVDLFFALSGYLITALLLREVQRAADPRIVLDEQDHGHPPSIRIAGVAATLRSP